MSDQTRDLAIRIKEEVSRGLKCAYCHDSFQHNYNPKLLTVNDPVVGVVQRLYHDECSVPYSSGANVVRNHSLESVIDKSEEEQPQITTPEKTETIADLIKSNMVSAVKAIPKVIVPYVAYGAKMLFLGALPGVNSYVCTKKAKQLLSKIDRSKTYAKKETREIIDESFNEAEARAEADIQIKIGLVATVLDVMYVSALSYLVYKYEQPIDMAFMVLPIAFKCAITKCGYDLSKDVYRSKTIFNDKLA